MIHHGSAHAADRCRPVEGTVADTWDWIVACGRVLPPPDGEHLGLDPAKERVAPAAWHRTHPEPP